MGARTKARKRALDLLFEAEQRGVNARDLLDERVLAPVTPAPLPEYTAVLVRGVVDNWRSINEALETYAKGWSLERMPAVDRALLRVSATPSPRRRTSPPSCRPTTRRSSSAAC